MRPYALWGGLQTAPTKSTSKGGGETPPLPVYMGDSCMEGALPCAPTKGGTGPLRDEFGVVNLEDLVCKAAAAVSLRFDIRRSGEHECSGNKLAADACDGPGSARS